MYNSCEIFGFLVCCDSVRFRAYRKSLSAACPMSRSIDGERSRMNSIYIKKMKISAGKIIGKICGKCPLVSLRRITFDILAVHQWRKKGGDLGLRGDSFFFFFTFLDELKSWERGRQKRGITKFIEEASRKERGEKNGRK